MPANSIYQSLRTNHVPQRVAARLSAELSISPAEAKKKEGLTKPPQHGEKSKRSFLL